MKQGLHVPELIWVVELEADAALRFLQDGQQIREIEVTPGETVVFRVDNTAGFPHNLYIGADEDLSVMGAMEDFTVEAVETQGYELTTVHRNDLYFDRWDKAYNPLVEENFIHLQALILRRRVAEGLFFDEDLPRISVV